MGSFSRDAAWTMVPSRHRMTPLYVMGTSHTVPGATSGWTTSSEMSSDRPPQIPYPIEMGRFTSPLQKNNN